LANYHYFIYNLLEIVFEIDSPKTQNKAHGDIIPHIASKLPSQDTCGKRKAPSFRIAGGIESDLGWIHLFIILNLFVYICVLKIKSSIKLSKPHDHAGVWPWMVALGYESKNDVNGSVKWMCGGSLISKQHVLTAGHCEGTRGSIIL
jgi:hypothetical protein